MMQLLANQTGSLVNVRQISKTLNVNVETVRKYLHRVYEVKYKLKTVRKNKYNFFRDLHPDIDLQFVDKDNVFEIL